MKRIHIETLGDKTAKVYRDSDYDEFRVRLYINGTLNAAADYHTSDKADAIETACAMVRPPRPHPLSVAFNVAVLHIVSKVLPCGFDVSEIAPQDFDSLLAHYQETGRVLVWNGASGKTIFADAEVNFAFRAWHDSKHIIARLPFNRAGKFEALAMQKADILACYDGATADSFCALLDAEIAGQFDYCERYGGFPIDQAAFARVYIQDKTRALRSDFGISTEV